MPQMKKLSNVLKNAQAYDFIVNTDNGFDTEIRSDGC